MRPFLHSFFVLLLSSLLKPNRVRRLLLQEWLSELVVGEQKQIPQKIAGPTEILIDKSYYGTYESHVPGGRQIVGQTRISQ